MLLKHAFSFSVFYFLFFIEPHMHHLETWHNVNCEWNKKKSVSFDLCSYLELVLYATSIFAQYTSQITEFYLCMTGHSASARARLAPSSGAASCAILSRGQLATFYEMRLGCVFSDTTVAMIQSDLKFCLVTALLLWNTMLISLHWVLSIYWFQMFLFVTSCVDFSFRYSSFF